MIKYIKKKLRKFTAWMNYSPPGAMSSKGWRLFEKEFREVAPVRHWIMKDFRRGFIYPIKWKYEAIKDWVRYRTTARYHVVDTGLAPGYRDTVSLMLHVNFNMLKEFVEVEQARSRYYWSDEYRNTASWCEKYMPFYRIFFPFRRPDLGIDHFEWAATLDDPALPPHERSEQQAQDAREILVLYKWWAQERPARKEIEYADYDDQGFGILGSLDDDFDKEAEDYKKHKESMNARSIQEEEWEKEDQDMLIRLIKIRKSLWT
jgi:hypothetical protein